MLDLTSKGASQSLEDIQVSVQSGRFNATVKSAKRDQAIVEITFQLPDEATEGDFFDTLLAELPGDPHIVFVPLHVRVLGPLTLAPSTVTLRRKDASDDYYPATVVVMGNNSDLPPGMIRLKSAETGIAIKDRSRDNAPV